MSTTIDTTTLADGATALVLGELQAELVAFEAAHLAERTQDPLSRWTYDALARAAEAGTVDRPELVQPLADLLELGLASGRIRAVHGPAAEQAARRLYAETPAGSAWRTQARGASAALTALAGRVLEGLTVSTAAPGQFSLEVEATGARVLVELDGRGVTVRSLELSGGTL